MEQNLFCRGYGIFIPSAEYFLGIVGTERSPRFLAIVPQGY